MRGDIALFLGLVTVIGGTVVLAGITTLPVVSTIKGSVSLTVTLSKARTTFSPLPGRRRVAPAEGGDAAGTRPSRPWPVRSLGAGAIG